MNAKIDQSIASKTRKMLNSKDFDSIYYLSSQIDSIPIASDHAESSLLSLFNQITHHLTLLSDKIEEEVVVLQDKTLDTEDLLWKELDNHAKNLDNISTHVHDVKLNFEQASDGAIRVGNKLAQSEKERMRIENSIELFEYINFYQDNELYEKVTSIKQIDSEKLRVTLLPTHLQQEDWGTISKALNDLRKILDEINSKEVLIAQKCIIAITQIVETELLGQFEVSLFHLMKDQNNPEYVENTRTIAEYLHLFRNGQTVHDRYIYSVVQRIPADASSQSKEIKLLSLATIASIVKGKHDFDEDDEQSSDGASVDGEEYHKLNIPSINNNNGNNNNNSLALIDHLSGLFSMINKICQEQFSIIQKIFPSHTIARVTRLLIQRIFNDPAFGIQARVDSILNPKPPNPSLPLADYLDALVTIREKLSALYLLLIECCNHPSMRGMGSESASLKKARTRPTTTTNSNNNKSKHDAMEMVDSLNRTGSNESNSSQFMYKDYSLYYNNEEDIEDGLRSDAEIREFFDEQISQVLSGYVDDYFEKELTFVRSQFVNQLKKSLDDNAIVSSKVSSGTLLLQLPKVKAERLKTISQMITTVVNIPFVNNILSVITDAVSRMESIGRSDTKKLPLYLKELFLLSLGFIIDGILLPCANSITTLLLKSTGNALKSSSSGGSNSSYNTPPYQDFFNYLSCVSQSVIKITSHYDIQFSKSLSILPNISLVCKESRKYAFKKLEITCKESIHAFLLYISIFIEKNLTNLQSKYDYNPYYSFQSQGHDMSLYRMRSNHEITSTCDNICKILLALSNTIRMNVDNLKSFDLMKLFWKPFGQLFIGIIISHIRKQKISQEGAQVLITDMDGYLRVMVVMESPEAIDMLICLKEICQIFIIPAEDVVRVVTEDMRYLDTAVVLGLTRSRLDFANRSHPDHWSRILSLKYSNYKWDSPLPWEVRKQLTVLSFADSMTNSQSLGPMSLRKTSSMTPATLAQIAEKAKANLIQSQSQYQNGKTNAIDLNQLENNVSMNNTKNNNNNSQHGINNNGLVNPDLSHLHANQQAIGNNHNSNTSIHSQFTPVRPNEFSMNNPINSNHNNSHNINNGNQLLSPNGKNSNQRGSTQVKGGMIMNNNLTTANVSRPDLIGINNNNTSTANNRSSVKPNGITQNSNGKPPIQTNTRRNSNNNMNVTPGNGNNNNNNANTGNSNGNGNGVKKGSNPNDNKNNNSGVFSKFSSFLGL
eukprot:gene5958-8211_t